MEFSESGSTSVTAAALGSDTSLQEEEKVRVRERGHHRRLGTEGRIGSERGRKSGENIVESRRHDESCGKGGRTHLQK